MPCLVWRYVHACVELPSSSLACRHVQVCPQAHTQLLTPTTSSPIRTHSQVLLLYQVSVFFGGSKKESEERVFIPPKETLKETLHCLLAAVHLVRFKTFDRKHGGHQLVQDVGRQDGCRRTWSFHQVSVSCNARGNCEHNNIVMLFKQVLCTRKQLSGCNRTYNNIYFEVHVTRTVQIILLSRRAECIILVDII